MIGGPRALSDGFEAKVWAVREPQWLKGQGQSAPGEGAERRAGVGMLEKPRERPLPGTWWRAVTAQWILNAAWAYFLPSGSGTAG